MNSPDRANRWSRLLPALALVIAAFLAYQPALSGGFIWDDDLYLTGNALIHAPDGWLRFWTTGEALDYYPLSSTSLWLEWRMWGERAGGYRLVNLLLHTASGLLLWRLLRRPLGACAWVAALLFVLHPVNAEAVAWIAQRKTVLATTLALGSALLWFRSAGPRGAAAYVGSLTLFLASLLSKTVAVALPAALLVLAWAEEGRLTRRTLLRLAPYFAFSLALGLVTMWFQRHHAIAHLDVRPEGFLSKLAGVGWCAGFYAAKFLWPHPLALCHLRWTIDPASPLAWAPLAGLLLVLAALWFVRARWGRWPLALVLAYLILLAPLLGLVDVGFMRYALVADHWQYHAMPALCALLAAAVARTARVHPRVLAALGALIAGAAILLTRQHAARMSDELRVWTHNVACHPDAWMGYEGLATAQLQSGRTGDAETNFLRAIELHPAAGGAQANLGALYAMRGEPARARGPLEAARQIDPHNPNALFNLARVHDALGDPERAVPLYEETLRYRPDDLGALFNLGNALLAAPAAGSPVRAREVAERACARTGRRNLHCLELLARTEAAAGDPSAAERTALEGAALARSHQLADEAARFEALAERYRSSSPSSR